MSMEIFLVRHGQSMDNVDHRIQGWGGKGLSGRGRNDATGAASRLKRHGITNIFSSDLPRALETASAISQSCGPEVAQDRRFREIHLGPWEGRLLREVELEDAQAFGAWRIDSTSPPYPDVEPLAIFRDRLFEGLEDVMRQASGPTVIVSHGGAISVILSVILEIDFKNVWRMPVANGSVSRIAHRDGRFSCLSYNESGHLGVDGPGFDRL